MKSNTGTFAQYELQAYNSITPKEDNSLAFFSDELIALADKFGTYGDSGGSAPFTVYSLTNAVKKLLQREPLAPLLGDPTEWTDVTNSTGHIPKELVWQNRRFSSVFKHAQGCYYLDAVVFKDEQGFVFTQYNKSVSMRDEHGHKVYVTSHQYIREFPFVPKKFYINVVTLKDGDYAIMRPTQMKKVYQYYLKK